MNDPIGELAPAIRAQLEAGLRRAASPQARTEYEASLERADEAARAAARRRRRRELLDGGWALDDDGLDAVANGTLIETRAVRAVSSWLASGIHSVLVLLGDGGTGKTTAAAHTVVVRSGPAVYVREPTLAKWWGSARWEREWRAVITAPTLVVDELGTAPARILEDARAALLEVVDARQRRTVRTVLVGNLSADDFDRRYDRRMIDRLRHVGRRVYVSGQSMRRERGRAG